LLPALDLESLLVSREIVSGIFFSFFIKRRQLNLAHMGVCDRMNKEPHTACLGCLHADSRKVPFDPESEWEQCKRQLEIDLKISFDIYYKFSIMSAIFTAALYRRNNACTRRRPQHRERSVQSRDSCGKHILLLSLKILVNWRGRLVEMRLVKERQHLSAKKLQLVMP
jgi:hypothetical protein